MKIAFIDNKYKKWYDKIIEYRQSNILLSDYEKHHILPKSLGGVNDKENIIRLSCREHFVCHLLLTKMCYDNQHRYKMCWALHRMAYSKKCYKSHEYELARVIHIKNLKAKVYTDKEKKKRSEYVTNSWKNADERRKKVSEWKRDQWANTEFRSIQLIKNRKNAKLGNYAAILSNTEKLEYKGKIYYGYVELKEKTGISNHLYKKYYRNGIDPEFRINANGPLPRKEVQ